MQLFNLKSKGIIKPIGVPRLQEKLIILPCNEWIKELTNFFINRLYSFYRIKWVHNTLVIYLNFNSVVHISQPITSFLFCI